MGETPGSVVLEACTVDLDGHVARWPDGERSLRPMEAKLLAWLAARPGLTVGQDELLREVWGYRGGVVTKTVQVTISRLRPKIERDPTRPVSLLTVPGAGYRLKVRPEDVRPVEPVRPAPSVAAVRLVRSTLPRARALIGREEELESLRALLERPGLVGVVGPLGAGKSALAVEAVRALTADAPRQAWFVDASELTDHDALVAATASVLGLATDDPVAGLVEHLEDRNDVLLLDGVDGVLRPAAKLTRALRAACPALTLVATARRTLRMADERVLRLGGLDEAASRALFMQRSTGDRVPGYDDAGAVDRALASLSGLPLAIELAAPWAGFLRPPELGEMLARKLDLLRSDRPDLPERHRNLLAALQQVWDELSAMARDALAAAAIFRAPFPASDLDLLAASEGEMTLPSRTLLELRGLVERSLVRRLDDGLLQLWGPVGTFVRRERPVPVAEEAHTAVMARQGAPEALRALDKLASAANLRLLKARAPDFERAAERAITAGDALSAVRCARALLRSTPHAFPSAAWCDLADRALALPVADEIERLDLVGEAHAALHATGRGDEAVRRLKDAARRAEQLGDHGLLSRLLRPEAALVRGSDPAASLEVAELAVEAAERSGDIGWLGRALCTRGISQRQVGDLDGGRETLEQGLRLLREVDDCYLIGPLVSLAGVELVKGRPQRALALLQEARDRSTEREHPQTGISLMLGRTLSQLGQQTAAGEHFETAVQHARRLGRQVEEALALNGQGEALRRWGDPASALTRLRRAHHLYAAHDHRSGQALAVVRMGLACLDLGDLRSARRYLERARVTAGDLEQPELLAHIAALEAELSVLAGDLERARACFEAGADLLEVAGAREDLVPLLERWAEMEADAGAAERAEALFERIDAAGVLTTVDAPAPVVRDLDVRRLDVPE